jgi:hypothetical protein
MVHVIATSFCLLQVWPCHNSAARCWPVTVETRVTSSDSRWTSSIGAGFLRVLRVSSAAHLSAISPYSCYSPDQAALYRTLGPKLGHLSLTRHLAGLRVNVV